MTTLQQRALAVVPLSKATVESFYDGSRSGTAEQCLKALCESHERLRAELEGCEILLKENDDWAAGVAQRLECLTNVLLLTDTGSKEFREAFPPRSVGESLNSQEIVPGWRVVEKIRELIVRALKASPGWSQAYQPQATGRDYR